MRTTGPAVTTATWRKSTYSGENDDACVEITARQFLTAIPIRDSKNPQGPAITPTPTAWATFVTAVATVLDLHAM
jgi:hypothetical protein